VTAVSSFVSPWSDTAVGASLRPAMVTDAEPTARAP
jgi:hypothetical protein